MHNTFDSITEEDKRALDIIVIVAIGLAIKLSYIFALNKYAKSKDAPKAADKAPNVETVAVQQTA